MKKKEKIFLTGHSGLVGSAILKVLNEKGYKNIITISKKKLNLLNQSKVFNFIKKNKPKIIINTAEKVGGIYANEKYQAQFIYENLTIQNNLIHGGYLAGVKNMLFLGSSCIYPKYAEHPTKEDSLLDGKLERTNEAYALAKIAGLKMCESYNFQYKTNYKCLIPTNLYGPNDNYHKNNSHFFPALIKKIHLAKKNKKKSIIIWGSGKPKREMMYSADLAEACIYFMNKKTKESLINIGSGVELSIKQYAEFIAKKLHYKVKFKFDKSKKDGSPRKILNLSIANKYKWKAKTSLEEGFKKTYSSFLKKQWK
jgi:GDP-L-fucose synthase